MQKSAPRSAMSAARHVIASVLATAMLMPFAHLSGDTPPSSAPYQYSRYGDFKSAQLRSTSTHGYGLYLAEMQMSLSPSVSTFWLYADSPSAQYIQDMTQLWRWNEIDFEFVPYTQSTQAEYFTFEWNQGSIVANSMTRYGAVSELSSILANTPNADAESYASWVQGLIRTDEVVAEQIMNAAAMGLSYTEGQPASGNFRVVVETNGTLVKSATIAYDADTTEVTTALNTMSDGNPFLSSLLPSGFVVVPAGAAGGAFFNTAKDSAIITVDNNPGLLDQFSPDDAVSQPGTGTQVFPSGTKVVSVDRTNSQITVSNQATESETDLNLTFTPASSWNVNFNGGTALSPDQIPNIYLELDGLTSSSPVVPVLGRLTPALNSSQDATGFNMRVFLSPLSPPSSQTWVEYLAANTGPGKTFGDATQWKYPVATLATPDSLPMDRMGTVNFWRMPAGDTSVTLTFPGYGTFERTGIYRGSLPGASDPSYFTSEPFNNEAFYWDTTGNYDPYKDVYTYVITWTPTRMAQYLLPILERDNNGLPVINIDNAIPLVEYDLTDYASLSQSGPQGTPGETPGTSGGKVPFTYTELAELVGNVSLNLANYVGYNQASGGANGTATVNATVSPGTLIVSNVNSFTADISVTQGNTLAMLSTISGGTPAAGMVITSDNTSLVPAATFLDEVWTSAYLITMANAATGSGTGTFTLSDGSGTTFSASGVVDISNNNLVLYNVPSGNVPAASMTITTTTPGLLPSGGTTVTSTSDEGTAVQLSQAPPQTGSDTAYLFNLVTTSVNETVSWIPQVGQLVSGTNIPTGSTVGSVSANGTSFTLTTPGNQTPTGAASSITLGTSPAGAGWSGPPPPSDMPDSSVYVRSIGFFAWTGDGDGSQTSDFNITSPASDGDNFWVDFSDTTTWTASTWQKLITGYFNLVYTNNFTHLGAQAGVSLQYPNISPANISLTTIDLPGGGSTQALALTTGANDLTLNADKTDWQTPPTLNFFQVSANSPSGQVSSSNPLLRVEVYETGNPAHYWTANSPVLSPTQIFAPPSGQTVNLTVNLWVLDSGTPPALDESLFDQAASPDYTATIQLSNPSTGPTFSIISDPNGIMATPSGRYIQVQPPAKPSSGDNAHPVSALNGFTLHQPDGGTSRDDHPKGRGTLRGGPVIPWYFSEVYGFWYAGALPWVYSTDFNNWFYTYGSSTEDLWLWSPVYDWLWASDYPYLYSSDRSGWLYLDLSGWLYDFNTETWEPLE